MIRVDEDFMAEVGLTEMSAEEKAAFMNHAQEELEVRVGQVMSDKLSEEQLDEFSKIDDPQVAAGWLGERVPDFREIVAGIFEDFKKEIASERGDILG